jgi:hypothetical protein
MPHTVCPVESVGVVATVRQVGVTRRLITKNATLRPLVEEAGVILTACLADRQRGAVSLTRVASSWVLEQIKSKRFVGFFSRYSLEARTDTPEQLSRHHRAMHPSPAFSRAIGLLR